jgi:hypothetical protein
MRENRQSIQMDRDDKVLWISITILLLYTVGIAILVVEKYVKN